MFIFHFLFQSLSPFSSLFLAVVVVSFFKGFSLEDLTGSIINKDFVCFLLYFIVLRGCGFVRPEHPFVLGGPAISHCHSEREFQLLATV